MRDVLITNNAHLFSQQGFQYGYGFKTTPEEVAFVGFYTQNPQVMQDINKGSLINYHSSGLALYTKMDGWKDSNSGTWEIMFDFVGGKETLNFMQGTEEYHSPDTGEQWG